ncbi:hypothetical protein, partial [Bacillus thuringiensis]|uniref:hypothetical protein n=1 Tax=Bacillus thuringiensis TaxID=1428 RepID=UPI002852CAFA
NKIIEKIKFTQFPLEPKNDTKIPGVPFNTGYTHGDIIWKQIAIAAKDTLTTGIIKNGKNKIGFKMTGIPTAKPQLELNITGSKLALEILSSSLDLLLVINTIT